MTRRTIAAVLAAITAACALGGCGGTPSHKAVPTSGISAERSPAGPPSAAPSPAAPESGTPVPPPRPAPTLALVHVDDSYRAFGQQLLDSLLASPLAPHIVAVEIVSAPQKPEPTLRVGTDAPTYDPKDTSAAAETSRELQRRVAGSVVSWVHRHRPTQALAKELQIVDARGDNSFHALVEPAKTVETLDMWADRLVTRLAAVEGARHVDRAEIRWVGLSGREAVVLTDFPPGTPPESLRRLAEAATEWTAEANGARVAIRTVEFLDTELVPVSRIPVPAGSPPAS